jgi:hypothetical protein
LVTEFISLEHDRRQGPLASRRDTLAGASSGWYKVTVTQFEQPETEGDIVPDRLRKKLGLKSNATPYRIKVVAHPEPGHYDIKLETYLGTGKAQEGVKK